MTWGGIWRQNWQDSKTTETENDQDWRWEGAPQTGKHATALLAQFGISGGLVSMVRTLSHDWDVVRLSLASGWHQMSGWEGETHRGEEGESLACSCLVFQLCNGAAFITILATHSVPYLCTSLPYLSDLEHMGMQHKVWGRGHNSGLRQEVSR